MRLLVSFVAIAFLAACAGGSSTMPSISATVALPRPAADSTGTIAPAALHQYPIPNGEVDGLAVGTDGSLWFTQPFQNGLSANDVIGRVTTGGAVTLFHTPTAASQPFGITLGPDGNMYAMEAAAQKLVKVTPSGVMTEINIPLPPGASSIVVGPLTTGRDGNLWFTDFPGYGATVEQLGRINLADDSITYFTTVVPASRENLTPGPGSTLWLSDQGGTTFYVYSTAGTLVGQYSVPNSPASVIEASDGNMWFGEGLSYSQSSPPAVGRLTPNGQLTNFPVSTNYEAVGQLVQIAQATDGNLYIGTNDSRIIRSSLSGSVTQLLFPASCPPAAPVFLVAGHNDVLWAWDADFSQIDEIDLNSVH